MMKGNTTTIFIWVMLVFLSTSSFSQSNETTTVFINVNLIPMTQDTIMENQTVIVKGTKIIAIGNANSVSYPLNTTIINAEGKYLMPGLADMHAHYSDYDRNSFFNMFLKNGVTTVRLFQSWANDTIPVWKDKIKKQEMLGPMLYNCGPFFDGKTPSENVLRTSEKNYDFIKIYTRVSKNEFQKIMRTAKTEGIYTIGHLPLLVGLKRVAKEGMNELAHINDLSYELFKYPKLKMLRSFIFPYAISKMIKDYYSYKSDNDYKLDKYALIDKTVSRVKDAEIFVNTTLIVDKLINEQLFEKEKFLKRRELEYMRKDFMPQYLAGETAYQQMTNNPKFKKLMKGDDASVFMYARYDLLTTLLKRMHSAGVILLLGTDCSVPDVATIPGYSVHDELKILTENGFTPYEAIKTGTANTGIAIKAMTGANLSGTIEINKQADLILTNSNPLNDVANIKDIYGIMVKGQWLTKMQLDTLPIIMKEDISVILEKTINSQGIEIANKRYYEIKKDSINYFNFSETELNILGYKYLGNNKIAEAIAIFKIAVDEYPNSWNSYDSLGEAYLKNGDKDLAKKNYTKSIELNPDNKGGIKTLKRIK